MALLIPAALLLAGCCVLGFAAWRDPELKGSGFAAILFFLLFGGPLGCLALGAWGLVRGGRWHSISISSILAALDKAGVDVRMLREPAPWPALQKLNHWYLEA